MTHPNLIFRSLKLTGVTCNRVGFELKKSGTGCKCWAEINVKVSDRKTQVRHNKKADLREEYNRVYVKRIDDIL